MVAVSLKSAVMQVMPGSWRDSARRRYWHLVTETDKLHDVLRFLGNRDLGVGIATRARIVANYYRVSANVACPHVPGEILAFVETILRLPATVPGCIVEAGCFKGGSTAKFSLAAKLAGRTLVVFDSFEGIPENAENHAATSHGANFEPGDYAGSLDEVMTNVRRHGCIDACRFVKGWFDDTLPNFHEPVAAIYLDVDLASSTRTCLKHLYPLLAHGGTLYSQDGHLPLVCALLDDDAFWQNELGCEKPNIEGLHRAKLVRIVKPHD